MTCSTVFGVLLLLGCIGVGGGLFAIVSDVLRERRLKGK